MSGPVTLVPSAGRLMESLRDIGYDLASAVADLVDNSVDAGATHVHIDVVAEGIDSWIRVWDDGLGMSRSQLDEAMRYGSHTVYKRDSLGHFGLGLKTASLSQCRRLTVASRARGGSQLAVRQWDLDEVVRTDAWSLGRVSPRNAARKVTEPVIAGSAQTVVVWEALDRILPKRPTEGLTARVLRNATEDVRHHLAMVFHRFLSGEAFGNANRVRIVLNGEDVRPWDPFARDELHTRALPLQAVSFEDADGHEVSVDVQPYVLPGQQHFSSPEAHREAGGPNRWNRHQGFYVYRRDRLIQPGGWNRLRTLDEHAKLARVAVDLPIGEEHRFAVDVAKRRVSIPEELRDGLRTIASGVVAQAQERYRDHLDSRDDGAEPLPAPAAEAISISRDWPAILAAVDDVLGADPTLRDALLVRLANADAAGLERLKDVA